MGELTFLQLSTTYSPPSIAGYSVGYVISKVICNSILIFHYRYFASGTGAAGLVGAFMWWEVRGLGVRLGVGMSSVRGNTIPSSSSLLIRRVLAHAVSYTVDLLFPAPKHLGLLIPNVFHHLQRYAQSSSPNIFPSIHATRCGGRRRRRRRGNNIVRTAKRGCTVNCG